MRVTCRSSTSGSLSSPRAARSSSSSSRNAAPEEEGQPGSQVDIADLIRGPGCDILRVAFDTKQKLGRDQHCLQRPPNTFLDPPPVPVAVLERCEQRLDISGCDRPPVCAARERCENVLGARSLVGRGAWVAGEDRTASRCRCGVLSS